MPLSDWSFLIKKYVLYVCNNFSTHPNGLRMNVTSELKKNLGFVFFSLHFIFLFQTFNVFTLHLNLTIFEIVNVHLGYRRFQK